MSQLRNIAQAAPMDLSLTLGMNLGSVQTILINGTVSSPLYPQSDLRFAISHPATARLPDWSADWKISDGVLELLTFNVSLRGVKSVCIKPLGAAT